VTAAGGRSRPSFLVIISDDQGHGDLGCFGAGDLRTPNLDRLAANGIRFTDFLRGLGRGAQHARNG